MGLANTRLLARARVLAELFVVSATADRGALDLYPPVVATVRALVDNFDPSRNVTFEQRYFIYDKWWTRGGPILLYLGNEGPIDSFYNVTGALFEHAEILRAMVVFVEHRYYGKSLPFGNAPTPQELRFLTIEQAMADYAWFLRSFLRSHDCHRSECPVVTFGGSYGGMLVAWFRQRYPQLTVGGVGSGAVIDFYPFDGRLEAFWNATLNTFDKYGVPGCSDALNTVLGELKRHASTAVGREVLQDRLQSCHPLGGQPTAGAKVDFFVRGVLSSLAMLDYPEASTFVTPLPANPVAASCRRFLKHTDSIAGVKAMLDMYLNSTGNFRCYDFLAEVVGSPTSGQLLGPIKPPDMGPWQYQACTELPLQTLTSDGFGFYVPSDNQLDEVAAACNLRYGVMPRLAWAPLSFGASDLRVGALFLSDGEKDPWRTGSIKMDMVQTGIDIQHIVIPGAAHHEDLRFDSEPPRPEVQRVKKLALAAMQRWISSLSHPSNTGSVATVLV